MSKELLEGVKALEKERGIEAETLLSAIEEALLAAYKKMPDARHPVRVFCGTENCRSGAAIERGRAAESGRNGDESIRSPGAQRLCRGPAPTATRITIRPQQQAQAVSVVMGTDAQVAEPAPV